MANTAGPDWTIVDWLLDSASAGFDNWLHASPVIVAVFALGFVSLPDRVRRPFFVSQALGAALFTCVGAEAAWYVRFTGTWNELGWDLAKLALVAPVPSLVFHRLAWGSRPPSPRCTAVAIAVGVASVFVALLEVTARLSHGQISTLTPRFAMEAWWPYHRTLEHVLARLVIWFRAPA